MTKLSLHRLQKNYLDVLENKIILKHGKSMILKHGGVVKNDDDNFIVVNQQEFTTYLKRLLPVESKQNETIVLYFKNGIIVAKKELDVLLYHVLKN